MESGDILERIRQADMVLVGLGEEFDAEKLLQQDEVCRQGSEALSRAAYGWAIPAWNAYCAARKGEDGAVRAVKRLRDILENKNYFVVSVSTNSEAAQAAGREDRVVSPCGGTVKKQCVKNCGSEPVAVSDDDREKLNDFFEGLYQGKSVEAAPLLGKCPSCGCEMVLNNILAENYNEKGYLDDWQKYMKWLQGTLNRKLLVLELGVGMKYPSVIRWPFEKVAAYNQKAFFCRVNEKIYQLPQEISTKGCGISQNAIAWLGEL